MKKKGKKQKSNKFFVVPQTEEEIKRNRKIIEKLRDSGILERYEKTFRIEKNKTIIEEEKIYRRENWGS